jgi:hypothetical protein
MLTRAAKRNRLRTSTVLSSRYPPAIASAALAPGSLESGRRVVRQTKAYARAPLLLPYAGLIELTRCNRLRIELVS